MNYTDEIKLLRHRILGGRYELMVYKDCWTGWYVLQEIDHAESKGHYITHDWNKDVVFLAYKRAVDNYNFMEK